MRLEISPEEFEETIRLYTSAYNFVASYSFENRDWNSISVHHAVYKDLRRTLPSQLAISSRMKAMEAIKSMVSRCGKRKKDFVKPKSKRCPIRYDMRSMKFLFSEGRVSLLTVEGRKWTSFNIPECYRKYEFWRHKSAELVIRNDTVFLHVVMENDFPDPAGTGQVIGVDRGIKHIAVTSDGVFHGSAELNRARNRYERIRRKLQAAGTRSSKRHLARLSGRAKRFCRDLNHRISRRIVESMEPGDVLVLEDLDGIRKNRLRKKQRKQVNSWPFRQLAEFLEYKAAIRGIAVEYVNPRYTSQKCSGCGKTKKSNRKGQGFYSCSCGFKLNADLNAARNIAAKFAESNGHRRGLPPTSPSCGAPEGRSRHKPTASVVGS